MQQRRAAEGFYDPGLFCDDDGKIYVAHGYNKIYVTELDTNFTAKSNEVLVFTGDIRPGLEGTHVYKIKGNKEACFTQIERSNKMFRVNENRCLDVSAAAKTFLGISLAISLLLLSSSQSPAQPLAEGHSKFLGNIIASSVPSTFDNYWNQITPENSGKWGVVESSRDVMNWSQLDIAYDHAQQNDYPYLLLIERAKTVVKY